MLSTRNSFPQQIRQNYNFEKDQNLILKPFQINGITGRSRSDGRGLDNASDGTPLLIVIISKSVSSV